MTYALIAVVCFSIIENSKVQNTHALSVYSYLGRMTCQSHDIGMLLK